MSSTSQSEGQSNQGEGNQGEGEGNQNSTSTSTSSSTSTSTSSSTSTSTSSSTSTSTSTSTTTSTSSTTVVNDTDTIDVTLTDQVVIVEGSAESKQLLSEIDDVYSKIQVSQAANHLGSINDYRELFTAVKGYYETTESEQLAVELDVSCIEKFTLSIKEYSALFEEITLTLSNISSLDDRNALRALLASLNELYAFFQVLARFKGTINGTSRLTVPDTIISAKTIINDIETKIDASLDQIEIFLGTRVPANESERSLNTLSVEDKEAIDKAKEMVSQWAQRVEDRKETILDTQTDVTDFRNSVKNFCPKAERTKEITRAFDYKLTQWRMGNYV